MRSILCEYNKIINKKRWKATIWSTLLLYVVVIYRFYAFFALVTHLIFYAQLSLSTQQSLLSLVRYIFFYYYSLKKKTKDEDLFFHLLQKVIQRRQTSSGNCERFRRRLVLKTISTKFTALYNLQINLKTEVRLPVQDKGE